MELSFVYFFCGTETETLRAGSARQLRQFVLISVSYCQILAIFDVTISFQKSKYLLTIEKVLYLFSKKKKRIQFQILFFCLFFLIFKQSINL